MDNLKKIRLTHENNVYFLYLDSPNKKNALDDELISEITSTLDLLNADDNCRVVLLGSTSNVFCSGGDVKAMMEENEMFKGDSIDLRQQYHFGIQQIARSIERFKKPIIAVVDGVAVGAGADLACMCDMRVGSNRAKFIESFANLALVPGDGGTFFLSRVVGYAKAMELFLTAEPLSAQLAYDVGLLNFLFSEKEVWDEAKKLANKIANKPPVAIEMTKQALKEAYRNRDLESNLNLLSAFQAITQRSQDHQRGLLNLKGGDEKFKGH